MQAAIRPGASTPLMLRTMLLILSMMAGLACAQPVIPVVGNEDFIRIAPSQLEYLLEPAGTDPAEFLRHSNEHPWQASQSLLLEPQVSEQAVWVRLRISNQSAQLLPRLLEIQWVNLNRISLFQTWPDGELYRVDNGLDVDQTTLYRSAANFLLPFNLQPQAVNEIFIRVETKHLLMLPFYIWEEESYGRYELNYYYLYGLLFGAMLVMLLYNLFLWIFTRDGNYLLYCLYLASTVLFLLSATGIGKHNLWDGNTWLTLHSYPLFAASAFFTAALFIVSFLQLKKRARWMYGFGILASVYWGIELLINLLSHSFPATMTNTAALITSMVALYVTVSLAVRGDRIAITFSIAWAFLISSTIILLVMLLGLLPQNFITQHIQSVGILMETVLISIALAQRINRERNLRSRAQQALLSLREQSNRELEERVQQRTEELEKLTGRLRRTNDELQRLSITDVLTGLYNRRYFDEVLYKEIIRSYNNGQPLALVLADIDHFKQFNDQWGHLAGDECLRIVAEELQTNIRSETDCVARYGGEEFAIIMPGLNEEEAIRRAQSICHSVAHKSLSVRGKTLSVTMSFGVTAIVSDKETTSELVTAQADQALYQAKDAGRNRVVGFTSTDN